MSMQDALLNSRQPESRLLLAAYFALETELKAQAQSQSARREQQAEVVVALAEPVEVDADEAEETAIGWVPRLREVSGIAPERLGPLHGQLIALGLLKFQLTGRTSGILYRLSPEGRSELSRADAEPITAELSAA